MKILKCFLGLSIFAFIIHISTVESQRFRSRLPKFYTFRQVNKTFYKVKNDPEQVKPDIPTRDNLFSWLNPKSNVKFRLYTRLNPDLAQEIKYNDMSSLLTSNFDPRKLTKVVIHGFLDGAGEVVIGEWNVQTKNNYLDLADLNVIVVDYSFRAFFTFYLQAIPETVGKRVAEMLIFLQAQGMALDSVHLIGWSWGAHISGIAGHILKGQIGRITGLDPAGPSFRFLDNEFRLDKTDAKFVDNLHTNGGNGVFWAGYFGLPDALGHVDIYFNGGQRQPGCPRERTYIFETLWCNHGRAPAYWVEAIQSPLAFPMCNCESLDKYVVGNCSCTGDQVSYSGEHIPTSTRGTFQLITRSQKPFGRGPHLTFSLPDDVYENEVWSGRSRSSNNVGPDPARPPTGTVRIEYENQVHNLTFKNTLRPRYWPSTQILDLSLKLVEEAMAGEALNNTVGSLLNT